jgi:hypothetical protein
MWKERIYVPINQTLREQAIRWCHDEPMAGHPGIAKTLELTTRTFWWPNMKKDIEKYMYQSMSQMSDQQTRSTTSSHTITTKQNTFGTMGHY